MYIPSYREHLSLRRTNRGVGTIVGRGRVHKLVSSKGYIYGNLVPLMAGLHHALIP